MGMGIKYRKREGWNESYILVMQKINIEQIFSSVVKTMQEACR